MWKEKLPQTKPSNIDALIQDFSKELNNMQDKKPVWGKEVIKDQHSQSQGFLLGFEDSKLSGVWSIKYKMVTHQSGKVMQDTGFKDKLLNAPLWIKEKAVEHFDALYDLLKVETPKKKPVTKKGKKK